MEGWRKNGIQGPPALYWTQRYNGRHYIGVTVYIKHAQLQFRDFLQHVSRVKTQYTAIRNLKAHLPINEILIYMDFAENFICSNADEVHSAYWNSKGVTLHPVVAYYKEEEELKHKNLIFVYDVTNNNSTVVVTILKQEHRLAGADRSSIFFLKVKGLSISITKEGGVE
ncbi:hypothetical protein DPMN_023934 [Dreissena polymorpha]|uniref:Uncharacterized protein n=1 Tax=Dreissena polymorpha TaxID=45954 RepID=A0A9D4LM25_DREPO|nr:hypothetical protein DPMN_023934 [Dreissena polymorpha]